MARTLAPDSEPPLLFERRRYGSESALSFPNARSKLSELPLEVADAEDSLVALSEVANVRSFSALSDSRFKSNTETPDGIRDISTRCFGDSGLFGATERFSAVAAALI